MAASSPTGTTARSSSPEEGALEGKRILLAMAVTILVGGLILASFWIGRGGYSGNYGGSIGNAATGNAVIGAAVQGNPSSSHQPGPSGGPFQGFNSQEEMMAAHHPEQARSIGGQVMGFNSQEEMMAAHHPGQTGAASGADPMAGHHSGGAAMGGGMGGAGGGAGGSPGAPACGGVSGATGGQANPLSGQKNELGIGYDDAGYQQLLQADKSVTLSKVQMETIVGLDIQLPCCGFKTIQASGNCGCGHHAAMVGLAKLMAQKWISRDKIQAELDRWKTVFYPDGKNPAGSGEGMGGC